jgi:hypothetical protein
MRAQNYGVIMTQSAIKDKRNMKVSGDKQGEGSIENNELILLNHLPSI